MWNVLSSISSSIFGCSNLNEFQINSYNAFITPFSLGEKASYGDVVGKINTEVAAIFEAALAPDGKLDEKKFYANIQNSDLKEWVKKKAEETCKRLITNGTIFTIEKSKSHSQSSSNSSSENDEVSASEESQNQPKDIELADPSYIFHLKTLVEGLDDNAMKMIREKYAEAIKDLRKNMEGMQKEASDEKEKKIVEILFQATLTKASEQFVQIQNKIKELGLFFSALTPQNPYGKDYIENLKMPTEDDYNRLVNEFAFDLSWATVSRSPLIKGTSLTKEHLDKLRGIVKTESPSSSSNSYSSESYSSESYSSESYSSKSYSSESYSSKSYSSENS